mmetsp:Transcript_24424/g.51829  ORF Transcript_24424/g.51829 Transcript_24424/m.51829 type:complete len:174 (+) Transcript_24424:2172-2693(+)
MANKRVLVSDMVPDIVAKCGIGRGNLAKAMDGGIAGDVAILEVEHLCTGLEICRSVLERESSERDLELSLLLVVCGGTSLLGCCSVGLSLCGVLSPIESVLGANDAVDVNHLVQKNVITFGCLSLPIAFFVTFRSPIVYFVMRINNAALSVPSLLSHNGHHFLNLCNDPIDLN